MRNEGVSVQISPSFPSFLVEAVSRLGAVHSALKKKRTRHASRVGAAGGGGRGVDFCTVPPCGLGETHQRWEQSPTMLSCR